MSKAQKLHTVRGTHDIFANDFTKFKFLEELSYEIGYQYGFVPIVTPVFESAEVFDRTLGESSDIVMKEMYYLETRGEEKIVLRPEFTASMVRAFLGTELYNYPRPVKLVSFGAVFRYERPQKGRRRQFHQVNFEILGTNEIIADLELIVLARDFLMRIGVINNVIIQINSLGDAEVLANYRKELIHYFEKHKSDLSENSLHRLQINPIRILDSKDAQDKILLEDAPKISDYYNSTSSAFFEEFKGGLDEMDIQYIVNNRLVRGLDYYNHTIFEFITNNEMSQNSILSGGRYNNLVKAMGGEDVPGLGFAAGVERLMNLMQYDDNVPIKVKLIPIGEINHSIVLNAAAVLRKTGLNVEFDYKGNLKKRLNRAEDSDVIIMFGARDIANGTFTIKNMKTGEQRECASDNVIAMINDIAKL